MKKNIEDMFNDPTPDPTYPEFWDEQYEMYLEDGLTPADLKGSDSAEYAAWLKKRNKTPQQGSDAAK